MRAAQKRIMWTVFTGVNCQLIGQYFPNCGLRPTGGPRNIHTGPRHHQSTGHNRSAATVSTVSSGPRKFYKGGMCGLSWIIRLTETCKLSSTILHCFNFSVTLINSLF